MLPCPNLTLLPFCQDFAAAGADMYTFHLEAAQPDTGKLSSTVPDAIVLEVGCLLQGWL